MSNCTHAKFGGWSHKVFVNINNFEESFVFDCINTIGNAINLLNEAQTSTNWYWIKWWKWMKLNQMKKIYFEEECRGNYKGKYT